MCRYTAAAVFWFQTHAPQLKRLNIGDPSDTDTLHPTIRDTILTRKRWQKPKPKRQPYTDDMYITLKTRVDGAIAKHKASIFSKEACVYDWVRLGLFTGSRGNEYVQTTGTRLDFSATPLEPSSGEWGGKPLAFILSDFTFLKDGIILTPKDLTNPACQPDEVWIRFRFDKGPKNFTTKKYSSTGHPIFDPVNAALSIVLRALLLKIPTDSPLAQFVQDSGIYRDRTILLSANDVRNVMRNICKLTYPDPNHFMHKNYMQIDCHSNRVTAAVALHNEGVDIPDIAQRLRWSVEAVQHYLRDSITHIGKMCQAAVCGAFKT